MSVKTPVQDNPAPKIAKVAFCLGAGSLVAMVLSTIGGFMAGSLGIISLLRSIVVPLSLAAILLGLVARKKIAEDGLDGHREAAAGLLLGIITLVLVVVLRILVAIIFLPMLFARV